MDDYTDAYGPVDQQAANWWEEPAPAGYSGPWPPPLAPGQSYGPLFGEIRGPIGPGQMSSAPPEANADRPVVAPPPAGPPPSAPEPPDGPPGPATQTGLLAPYTGAFAPPPTPYPGATGTGVPGTPTFTPPGYTPPPAFSYGDFRAPTSDDVLNDPGYQFSAREGERALQQSKAAGGILNTGGTLKDILAWGQNYAATRYGDVYNRQANTYGMNRANAVDTYNRNYQTQFSDPYQIAYKGTLDSFAPQMVGYSTNAQANQRENENSYNRGYDLFRFDFDKWRDQRDSSFNKTFQWAAA